MAEAPFRGEVGARATFGRRESDGGGAAQLMPSLVDLVVYGLVLGSLGGLVGLAVYGSLSRHPELAPSSSPEDPALLELAVSSLASCVRRDGAGAARHRCVTLGRLEEIELLTSCGYPISFDAGVELHTADGRKLSIGCSRIGLLSRMRVGWRPWRRRIARVSAVSYRTMRWAGGLMDRKGAALAQRWGAPAYRHEFAGPAWLICGVTGRLSIEGSFSLEPLATGWGMIRG